MELNALLLRAVSLGASDVHLKLGQPPVIRRDGALERLAGWPSLTSQDLETALAAVTEGFPQRRNDFMQTGELDIGYSAEDLPRFRVNVFRQRGAVSLAMRAISASVPSFEQLRMPLGVSRLAVEAALDVLAGRQPGLEPYARAISRRLGPMAAASWDAKIAFDRFPRLTFLLAGAPLVWSVVERILSGDLSHPGAARGLPRAPLRAIEALAKAAGAPGSRYRLEARAA